MLKIKPPEYIFCPFCGRNLENKVEDGEVRKFCAYDKWTYYPTVSLASAAIITDESKVLLVKRNREPYKGTWMFPAGFVSYGEHPEETLIREVREETKLSAEKPKLINVFQGDDDPRAMGILLFVYRVETKGKIANSDTDENSEIGWFNIDNPPQIGWKVHKLLMERLQNDAL